LSLGEVELEKGDKAVFQSLIKRLYGTVEGRFTTFLKP